MTTKKPAPGADETHDADTQSGAAATNAAGEGGENQPPEISAERQAEIDAAVEREENALQETDAAIVAATGVKDWSKGAIIVAGPDAVLPERSPRPIIVVQTRSREEAVETVDEETGHTIPAPGTHRNGGVPPLKKVKYPEGGQIYLRAGGEADFGDLGPVLTIGRELKQAGTSGLSTRVNEIHVGPASPVYAAVDLAKKRGAPKVEILDLGDDEKAFLAPWFAKIADQIEVTFG